MKDICTLVTLEQDLEVILSYILYLNHLKEKGMNSAEIIGLLASSLDLVPKNSKLSASELLSELNSKKIKLDYLFASPQNGRFQCTN